MHIKIYIRIILNKSVVFNSLFYPFDYFKNKNAKLPYTTMIVNGRGTN